ncbi:MAG: MMPL family transporter, partial [Candidatus Kariarchaeaceae archaeon]
TPAILSIWGRFLDWPNVISRANQDVERQKADDVHDKDLSGAWMKWSRLVMRRPIEFLVIGIIILAPFVILSSQVNLSFDSLQNLPDGTESREGFEIIIDEFNLGQTTPYLVVLDLGEATNIFDTTFNADPIFDKIALLAGWALQDDVKFEGIDALSIQLNESGLIFLDMNEVKSLLASNGLFTDRSQGFINYDHGNNTLIVELYANLDQGTEEAWNLADNLRGKVNELFSPLTQIEEYWVTGIAPAFKDTSDAMYADVPYMILVAVVLIYLALLVLFRSLILPAKAIFTIAGSIMFGLGVLVFIFQEGNLLNIEILGATIWKTDQTTGLMFFLPVFIFTTILGLGMDYSIFIITRIKEEYEKGVDISTAVGIGLGKTAGVVTSAAVIMTTTFMVFALSPLLVLKMMGLALSVGIVVDATISRIILLPAAMKLAGKWNWYLPKWMKKILPEIELDH